MSDTTDTDTESDDGIEAVKAMIEQQHTNLVAIAEVAGVPEHALDADADSEDAKSFKARLTGTSREKSNDGDEHVELFKQNLELTLLIGEALDVPESKLEGETDAEDAKSFKSRLVGVDREKSSAEVFDDMTTEEQKAAFIGTGAPDEAAGGD